jgi:hypothetical protein
MNDDGDILTRLRRTLTRHQTLTSLTFPNWFAFFLNLQLGAPAHHTDRCWLLPAGRIGRAPAGAES